MMNVGGVGSCFLIGAFERRVAPPYIRREDDRPLYQLLRIDRRLARNVPPSARLPTDVHLPPRATAMSGPPSRLRSILGHFLGSGSSPEGTGSGPGPGPGQAPHLHTLSPTFFLERAAAIEPDAEAVYHITANGAVLRRSYAAFADRARGLAYFLKKRRLRRVGVLAPNTPAFLETIYGVVAAGGVVVPANCRLKEDDVAYIFTVAEVDAVVVDREFEALLGAFRTAKPGVTVLVDVVSSPPPSLVLCVAESSGHGCYRGRAKRPVRRCCP